MTEGCGGSCDGCAADCPSAGGGPESLLEQPHNMSSVKKVIGVVSGKGGVGKSLVTSLLAVLANRKGFGAGILDADVTGPSIPKIFGVDERAIATELGIIPQKTKTGIEMISLNLLLEDSTDPVVWRGPVIAGLVKQFWTDVIWHNIDFLFVDMPPGTGDVPLTVFQSLPVDGIVVVTSPQELVSMIVEKAVKMANMMNVPVLGVVENMAYFECPDCGKQHPVFGESHAGAITEKYGIEPLAKIPVNAKLAAACDAGLIELFEGDWLDSIVQKLESLIEE